MKIITNKSMEACTSHITENDSKLLDMDFVPLSVYKYEYGWFIHVNEESNYVEPLRAELEGPEGTYKKDQFSEAFMALMRLAKENKCKFLQLDCDGTEYPDLPKYSW